jgi:aminoglycoside 3-N-acetyltransferase
LPRAARGSIIGGVGALSFRDLQKGLRELGLTRESRVLAFVSLPALGPVRGGAEAVAGALTALCRLVVMPAFTPQCQVWPLVGPANNGDDYAGHEADNAAAEFFRPDLPAHLSAGAVAEALRHVPGARRSSHPLYSFAAVGEGAEMTLAAQSLAEPLGPIAHLAEDGQGAEVLLLGVDQTANAALHYAEARAGRKQFVRWALTPEGVVECPACPGCPDGFGAIIPFARYLARLGQVGGARAERIPLAGLVGAAVDLMRRDPAALLCARADCRRCGAVRGVMGALGQAVVA